MANKMEEIQTLDIKVPTDVEVPSAGTAFIRIDPSFRDFIHKCHEKHGVIGFEYDGESLNFGVILGVKDGKENVTFG